MRLARLAVATLPLLLLGAALPALHDPGEKDYQAIPPPPGKVFDTLTSMRRIDEALEIARNSVEGSEVSSIYFTMKPTPSYVVELFTPEMKYVVTLSAVDGAVLTNVEVPRFPGESVSGEWTVTESGLKYWDIKVGGGDQPASSETTVTVHYTGWLVDGTKFDSSRDTDKPATFPLNRVIKGWTEGVGSMRVGGIRKLIIPYSLGYGSSGSRDRIPPKATLIFDVELLGTQ